MSDEEMNALQAGIAQQSILGNAIDNLLSDQVDRKQPVYVICRWWCGAFAGIEEFSTEGEKDLDDIKKLFMEKYAWTPSSFGITEQGFTLEKITCEHVLDIYGDEATKRKD